MDVIPVGVPDIKLDQIDRGNFRTLETVASGGQLCLESRASGC